jgi:hypothetical protein
MIGACTCLGQKDRGLEVLFFNSYSQAEGKEVRKETTQTILVG